jgi:hypothetical protein
MSANNFAGQSPAESKTPDSQSGASINFDKQGKKMNEPDYQAFIADKATAYIPAGFEPSQLGSHLFDFQAAIVEWACKRGRAAIFADTGLGKTAMQTEWARQVNEHTGGDVLIVAPLCVAQQTVEEAAKFGIHVRYCRNQDDVKPGITITNYEMLEKFDPAQFAGVVLDESSILKSNTSKTRALIIEMMQCVPYRLSCTATPSPNDHMELGNQAEFLGVMTAVEMLAMYFVHDGGDTSQWRLKGHGKTRFWEWMATWSICIRNPADLGFDGSRYNLPGLSLHDHVLDAEPMDGQLFAGIAQTLTERRQAKRGSLDERIKKVKELVSLQICHKMAAPQQGEIDAMETGICDGSTREGKGRSGVCTEAQRSGKSKGCGCAQVVHGELRRSESDEVQANTRAAIEGECHASQKICGERVISGDCKSEGEGLAGCEPTETARTKNLEVRTDAGIVQSVNGKSEPQLRHMRPLGEEAENVSDDRPLSRLGSGSGDSVLELQHGNREVHGQHGSTHEGNQVSRGKPRPWLIWCHLNDEQDALEKEFGDQAFSVRGSMSMDEKEAAVHGWLRGDRPIMISKASILGFGLNFQHCADMIFAGLDDSFESFYQAVRRCHRYGQKHVVDVHLISSESEGAVKANLERKQAQSDDMANSMVAHMRELSSKQIKGVVREETHYTPSTEILIPSWIKTDRM